MMAFPVQLCHELLRFYRRRAKLKQTELAHLVGCTSAYISMLEHATRLPYDSLIRELASHLALNEQETHQLLTAPRILNPTVPADALIGRENEYGIIEQHLQRKTDVPLLLFSGPPGIGKTRLLEEAVQLGTVRSMTILFDQRNQQLLDEPYAPLIGPLNERLRTQSSGQSQLDFAGGEGLIPVFPALETLLLPPSFPDQWDPQEKRLRIFHAMERVLTNLAGKTGVLLLLDDLHWASEGTLALLDFLFTASTSTQVHIIGAFRSPANNERLATYLASWPQRSYTISPLPTKEATTLLCVHSGPSAQQLLEVDREHLLCLAEGRPYLLERYGVYLQQGGDPAMLPSDITTWVSQRVQILPPPARDLIELLAVIGRDIPYELLAEMLQQFQHDWQEIANAEQLCTQAGFFQEPNSETYQMAHALDQRAICQGLSGVRQYGLHRIIAEVLARQPTSMKRAWASEIARHYLAIQRQALALPYLLQAGKRDEATFAYGDAQQRYQQVRDIAKELNQVESTPSIYAYEAQALEHSGRILRELAQLDEAMRIVQQAQIIYQFLHQQEGIQRTSALLARIYGDQGNPDEGIRILRRELANHDLADSSVAVAEMYLALAGFTSYEERLVSAERAAAIASKEGDERLWLRAMRMQGMALQFLGRLAAAMQVQQQVIERTKQLGDLADLAPALNSAAYYANFMGRFTDSRDYMDQALALKLPDPVVRAFHWMASAHMAFNKGDWQIAQTHIENSFDLLEPFPEHPMRSALLAVKGCVRLAQGFVQEAESLAQESVRIATASGNLQSLRVAASVLAELNLMRGQAAKVKTLLDPLIAEGRPQESDILRLLPWLAWAYVELEQVEQAGAILSIFRIDPAVQPYRLFLVDAWRVQALVENAQGRWTQAQQAIATSIELCRAMPYPYAEAKALYTFGWLYARRHEQAELRSAEGYVQACQSLQAAQRLCQGLGERLYARKIAQTLQQLCP